MRSLIHTTAAAAGVLAAVASLVTAPPAAAAGARDVTADVLAGRDVTLCGATVVTVPPGTTTYDGVCRGQGTLTVRGRGTLVLTRDSDFTLPRARQQQRVRTAGGSHPYVTVSRPDPPAVTVERGATLQYGDGGTTGLIGHFPYDTPAFRLNQDNIRVDGTLRLSLRSAYTLGTISGSGRLKEVAHLKLAGTAYRLTYRGGDGNDVVLTADRAPRPSPTPSAPSAPSAVASRSAGAAQHLGFGWWPYALGSALVISLAVPVATRRGRGVRRGGRHAGRTRR